MKQLYYIANYSRGIFTSDVRDLNPTLHKQSSVGVNPTRFMFTPQVQTDRQNPSKQSAHSSMRVLYKDHMLS